MLRGTRNPQHTKMNKGKRKTTMLERNALQASSTRERERENVKLVWGKGGIADPNQAFDFAAGAAGAGVGAGVGAAAVPVPPAPPDDEGRPNTSLPTFSPPSLFLSISTPTRWVLDPSQSILLTPPSQPPPMRVHRSLYASATRRCAREPSPSECHSSGVTQVISVECTA